MHVRAYGEDGPWAVVLHGGPGAPGGMAPVARELAEQYRVLEPFQRGSGEEPLTVARHVADLHELITSRCESTRPALIGSSWGAMLALAYAAAHPRSAGPLVLVGCGTFDLAARARFKECIDERLDDAVRRRLESVAGDIGAMGQLLFPVFSYDPLTTEVEVEPCDEGAHTETWNDMLRLQEEGTYPAAFAAIESPVLMLHGAFDPHPGRMVRDGLRPHLADLLYVEWERCGHYPWIERHARDEFFAVLRSWLAETDS